MSRRRRRERPHDWSWHEERLAEPWASFAVLNEDKTRVVGTLTERRWRQALDGKRQQMAAHDAQPERLRRLVAEHNVTEGQRRYREGLLSGPRCPHGRLEQVCAQCTYRAAQGRSGATIERKGNGGRAIEVLERARARRDAE